MRVPALTPELFYSEWEDFLENVRHLLKRQATAKNDPLHYDPLKDLVDDVIDDLKGRGEIEIRKLATLMDPTVRAFYGQELLFFNNLYGANGTNNDDKENEHGKTIKESMEKLLEFFHIDVPDWLKGVLKILNELMDLLKK